MFHDGWMWGWHWLWWLFWIAIVVVAIYLLTRALSSTRRDDVGGRESALDVLEKRYARGEISSEEYEERRSRLKGS